MLVQYEEKTFESYFNSELSLTNKRYYSFGQVQEGGLGADCAFMYLEPYLWDLFNKLMYYGEDLKDISEYMNEYLLIKIKNIPSIKTNILFQYKRPEVITTSQGNEWHYWNEKYFRYSIYKKQQSLLERIHNKFCNKVLVLYASPAIYDIDGLVRAHIDNKIIESTNFCQAHSLKGHHHNTYTKAGKAFYACSEPEEIPCFNFTENLQEMETQDLEPVTIITKFMLDLRGLIEEDPYWGRLYRMLLQPYKLAGLEEYPYLFGSIAMNILKQLTGIQWIVATKGG
ncbi:hypothetical protein [Morganella morganii]|uniref:hypothetical protein n=1 Tax=Morganella morganii TaxID=582 RepID=UPI003EBA7063